MSKITFIIENMPDGPEAIFTIHKVTGKAIAEIKRRVQSRTVLVEYVLFMNDHDEVAKTLRKVLETLSQAGTDFRIFESDDVEVESSLDSTGEIDASVLENILSSHEEAVEHLRQLNQLGHR